MKTQKFNRLLQAKQAGEISTKDFKDGCNKFNLLGVQLDTSVDELAPETDEQVKIKKIKAPETSLAAPEVKNSLWDEYNSLSEDEKKKYADIIMNPGKVDEGLWAKAKRAADEAGADNQYAFATYWYQKQGGKFG